MYKKRIFDEIHGYIEFNDLELKIVETPVFQRLRRIKQTSSAYMVYPGANHTRFSHSIGVMHVIGRIAEKLLREGKINSKDEVQLMRIAGMLHDIEQFPFSHTIEQYYVSVNGDEGTHESLGRIVIREDPYIKTILSENGFSPDEVIELLWGKGNIYSSFLNGDVDADRIDYLLRDAKHTGVAYGFIDIERLIDTIDLQGDLITVHEKGLQALDSFYLSRLHMYQSVYFHKTIVAYELLLLKIFKRLLKSIDRLRELRGIDGIKKMIISDEFWKWDDYWLYSLMYEAMNSKDIDEQTKMLISQYYNRKGPKVLLDMTSFINRREEIDEIGRKLISLGFSEDALYPFFEEIVIVNREEAPKIKSQRGLLYIDEHEKSILGFLSKKLFIQRIYCDRRVYDQASSLIKSLV